VTLILFWIVSVLIAFAIALAMQMRVMISYSLRRALAAKFGGSPVDPAFRAAILMAGRGAPQDEAGRHLQVEYPVPLAWLGTARRVSLIAPLLLLLVVLAGRFGLGVI
jgi:hypothetical protein